MAAGGEDGCWWWCWWCRCLSPPSKPPFNLDSQLHLDYYQLLSLTPDASTADIKLAYHRTLLLFHPDKLKRNLSSNSAPFTDIAVIKDAYYTLSSPHLRAQYDCQLQLRHTAQATGPRPAQVVSLEDFEAGSSATDTTETGPWCYKCRCGGVYAITHNELEEGRHLVGCCSCSEVVWVGYKLAANDEDD